MAKYFWDLDATFGNNTDVAGQSTQGSVNANTIDTIFQKILAVLGVFGDQLGGIGTVAGTADAVELTSSGTYPIQSLANGVVLAFKAASANTGAATINVDTLGVKKVRRQGDSALSANDIVANGIYLLRYDTAYDAAAGAWVLLNPTVSSSISSASTTEALTGTDASKYITADALAALWEKGSDVASASTITLGEGGYFHITGTTTITDIDWATAKNGRGAWVVFDGALTLTHNAITLKLPGEANITTAAGDRAYFVQDSSDNVVCMLYERAASSSTGLTLGTEQATTSGSSKDFTIAAGAKMVKVMLSGVSLSSTGNDIGIQLGDAGGVETTSYVSSLGDSDNLQIVNNNSSTVDGFTGIVTLCRMNTTHTWLMSSVIGVALATGSGGVGSKTLSAELTTVRFMTDGTFDAGTVNVLYE